MKFNFQIIIAILLSSCCFGIEFIDIGPTSQTEISLSKKHSEAFYAFTSPIEKGTDTIVRFIYQQVDPEIVKVYMYFTQGEAEEDYGKYEKPKWTNSAKAKELVAHLDSFKEQSLPKLFIIIKCVYCIEESPSFQDTFQITNELYDRITITPGLPHLVTTLYSRKQLLFSMKKTKKHIGFRFKYTPITEQELTVDTYLNSEVISTITSDNVIQISRNEEYQSEAEYYVTVTVKPKETGKLFELTVELSEFIQPMLIDPMKRLELNFNEAQHDLYYYIDMSTYALDDENTLTLTIKQTEGQQPVVPIIYAKDAVTTAPLNEYDLLVPKQPDQSIFKVYNKDNTHFILYFKQSVDKSIVLLINVCFIKETPQASLILSAKADMIEDTFIEALMKYEIDIEDNVPYHVVISSYKYAANLLVYVPAQQTHRLFIGRMMNDEFAINPNAMSNQLHAIQNKESYLATYEFFGKAGRITLYLEPIGAHWNYEFEYRKSTNRTPIQLGTIGQTYYFIESSQKTDKTYHLVIEELVGKFEYVFKETITITEQTTTLLPLDTDVSKGIEKLSTEFVIFGIKALSPGQVVIAFREDTPTILDIKDSAQQTLVFLKDKKYTLNMPSSGENKYALYISAIKFHNEAEDTILIKYAEGEKTIDQANSFSYRYNKALKLEITPSIESYASIALKTRDQTVFTEINPSTNVIQDPNVILKLKETDIADYTITFGKDISFKYDIGVGEDAFIPLAYNPTSAKNGEEWLKLSNPMIESRPLLPNECHYMTMAFEQTTLPITITIHKTELPKQPKIEIGTITPIKSGATVCLDKKNDYTPNAKHLVIVASSCPTPRKQSMTLSYYQGTKLHSWQLNGKKIKMEQSNLNIPLYLKYSDNSMTPGGLTAKVSYNYLSDEMLTAVRTIFSKTMNISSNGKELTWDSPSVNIKQYTVYTMKEGTNTSALDDECYLQTLEGRIVSETKFMLDSHDKGRYLVSVVALNEDNIPFTIISTPLGINVDNSLAWLWILLGVIGGLIAIGGGIGGFLYYKKKSDKSKRATLAPLISPYESS